MSKCKYCDVKNDGESTLTFTDNDFGNYPVSCGIVRPEISIDDYHLKAGVYYLETEGDDAVFQAINYCPMCGRKLND